LLSFVFVFFFSSRRRHTRFSRDWSSDVCSSDLLFLMFLILLTQFNSFYQVFITLTTVVMSSVGVILGMIVTGQPFSAIMTGIGIDRKSVRVGKECGCRG